MPNITPELKDQIVQAPEKEFSVIIVLKGDQLPPALENKGKFIMSNQIFSARLNGKEIQSLQHDPLIEGIESDMEMGML
jgi:hypothetical protein